jgi:DNA mismatch endonuclease (patch repair protein)
VFCDLEFRHVYNYIVKKERFKTNSDFWENKILGNIERDNEVTSFLEFKGWIVLRFCGKEILNNTHECARKVEEEVRKRS